MTSDVEDQEPFKLIRLDENGDIQSAADGWCVVFPDSGEPSYWIKEDCDE